MSVIVHRGRRAALPALPEIPEPPRRVVTVATVAAAIGAIALILPELWLAAGGLVWALAGLLHLGAVPVAVLAAVIGMPVLWASIRIVRWAFDAETDPENASV